MPCMLNNYSEFTCLRDDHVLANTDEAISLDNQYSMSGKSLGDDLTEKCILTLLDDKTANRILFH